jgi:hypothetical protein
MHVQLNSELMMNRTLSQSYAVRFAGLFIAASSGRYTFSFSQSEFQPQLSVFIFVDGVDISKLQPDGRIPVTTSTISRFYLFAFSALICFWKTDFLVAEYLFEKQPHVHNYSGSF